MKAFWFWSMTLTICLQLCFVFNAEAKLETITHTVRQPFGGSQSPDDARVAAMHKAKREALERAGVYIESLTVVKDHVVEKDEILALTAGVLKAEIISQKNYASEDAFGIEVVAKVDVDTSILEERVKKLLADSTLLKKWTKSQHREKELLAKVERLQEDNRKLRTSPPQNQEHQKEELKKQFSDTSKALTAVEWVEKALRLMSAPEDFAQKWTPYTDPEKALEYLSEAIRLDPSHPALYALRATGYHALGRYQRAIGNYDKAIRLAPRVAEGYFARGVLYDEMGQHQQAIRDYDKSITLKPTYAPPYSARGTAYHNLGQYSRAVEDHEQAIRLDPKLLSAYIGQALAYEELAQFDRAIESYTQMIELNPQDAGAYVSRGLVHGVHFGQHQLAFKDFNQAITLDPKYAAAYAGRGATYIALGQHTHACRDLRKACELGFKDACNTLRLHETKGYCP
jgi:tetratricopeptide (TPR) repeat protein